MIKLKGEKKSFKRWEVFIPHVFTYSCAGHVREEEKQKGQRRFFQKEKSYLSM